MSQEISFAHWINTCMIKKTLGLSLDQWFSRCVAWTSAWALSESFWKCRWPGSSLEAEMAGVGPATCTWQGSWTVLTQALNSEIHCSVLLSQTGQTCKQILFLFCVETYGIHPFPSTAQTSKKKKKEANDKIYFKKIKKNLILVSPPIHSSKAGSHMLVCKIKYKRHLRWGVETAKKPPKEYNEKSIILFNKLIELYKTYYALCLIFVSK